MDNQNRTSKDKIYDAMSFIPPFFLFLHFWDIEKSERLQKNIKRGEVLFGIYILISIIVPFIDALLFIIYSFYVFFLASIAYSWDEASVWPFETIVELFEKDEKK